MSEAIEIAGDAEEEDIPPAPATGRRLRWWHEVLFAAAFYAVYTTIRNTQGSAAVSSERAFHNARRVIRAEQLLGMWHERAIQHAFLSWRPFIQFWDVFYGTFHFIVTIVALVVVFRYFPARYARWRNTLAITTGLALVGFAVYPLMPPRLLPASYRFVDTLKEYGGLWSFDSGTMQKLSNQYAAMPSLHFAWSTWCAFVLVPTIRPAWGKVAMAAYPLATLFAIVVTANHYILDAVGGAVVLAGGAAIGFRLAGASWWHPAGRPTPNAH